MAPQVRPASRRVKEGRNCIVIRECQVLHVANRDRSRTVWKVENVDELEILDEKDWIERLH